MCGSAFILPVALGGTTLGTAGTVAQVWSLIGYQLGDGNIGRDRLWDTQKTAAGVLFQCLEQDWENGGTERGGGWWAVYLVSWQAWLVVLQNIPAGVGGWDTGTTNWRRFRGNIL